MSRSVAGRLGRSGTALTDRRTARERLIPSPAAQRADGDDSWKIHFESCLEGYFETFFGTSIVLLTYWISSFRSPESAVRHWDGNMAYHLHIGGPAIYIRSAKGW